MESEVPFDGWTAFNIVAGLASVLGLFFSFVAWRRAKGAEDAAKQAREAVRQSNASEELQNLSQLAKELLATAQNSQYEATLLRSRDLLTGIPQASQRWKSFLLMNQSSDLMEDVAREVGKISRAVSGDRTEITPEVREKLLKSCHKTAEALAAVVGRMQRQVEGSAQNG